VEKKRPLPERLAAFEAMWTTEAYRYVLAAGGPGAGYLPIDISGDQEMAVLIDEDDELAEAVAERMRAAGVPIRR
jgi:hypothetical protein